MTKKLWKSSCDFILRQIEGVRIMIEGDKIPKDGVKKRGKYTK